MFTLRRWARDHDGLRLLSIVMFRRVERVSIHTAHDDQMWMTHMDKLNSQNILADTVISKGERRRLDWPTAVVLLASGATIAWIYVLGRACVTAIQFAIL